ncbi:unnamed protein product [Thelazia callipaeda]|uniref:Coiled-coil domain-containing protein 146 n=1 Tax=Thelazia callipaeda TaxID=103827 RepID=A0A0N5D8I9_THECL|nr:unnamed protein product [Thelazia callipaeda]
MDTFTRQLKEEYEKRLHELRRSLHGEKERYRQLGFQYKQVVTQLKKVQRDNRGMENQLKALRKCASCSHLDQRSKSYNALNELLRGSAAALQPEDIVSGGSFNRDNELKAAKLANSNLQQCVDKLQSALREKSREVALKEKYYNEAILEREAQITQLQNELSAQQTKGHTSQSMAQQHAQMKLDMLLKERNELLDRITRLEEANQNIMHNDFQNEQHEERNLIPSEKDGKEYCEYCRNRKQSWNRMLNAEQSLNYYLEKDKDNIGCSPQEIVLRDRIQELSYSLKMERERNKEMENTLKAENNKLRNDYQKLYGQYESLTLELSKRESARVLESNVVHFERQLKNLTKQNEISLQKCADLERAKNLILQEKLEQLKINEILRKRLTRLEEDQKEKNKNYDMQIEVYQELIKQKDQERGALIAELYAAAHPKTIHNSLKELGDDNANAMEHRKLLKQLQEINFEKDKMANKITNLELECQSKADQLRAKSKEVETEIVLKKSLHDDLSKARTMLLDKESEIHDLNNGLKIAEVKMMKLETELANAIDRLQVERTIGTSLRATLEELENLLREKNAALFAASQDRQHCTSEIQKMKELKYDMQTKL